MKRIDSESIFQLVNKKDWTKIIEIFKDNDNYNFIINEPVLKPLIDEYFIDELLTTNDPAYKHCLTNFYVLHESPKYVFKLNENNYRKLIVKIVEVEKDLATAYNYATIFKDEPICKKIIEQYQRELPKIVQHSQESKLYVTENKNVSSVNASISLFKSNQEYSFYKAIREIYPTYFVIPNVSLNAIINFDMISNKLSSEEKKYFFGALIDCVVIDTENNYKPIKFIELDSHYHDKEKQIKNDKMKDNILAVAGLKLIRIRPIKKNSNENDFITLIRETISIDVD